jgi:small GTP-binding protein
MGVLLSLFSIRKAQVLILGLDASGKTTILYMLKNGTGAVTVPTIGFNAEEIRFGRLSFVAFDIGGQDRIRKMWAHYFPKTDGIVFVIDSADKDRLTAVKAELDKLNNHPLLQNIPFLIFANKQDLPNALTKDQMCRQMGLFLYSRKYNVVQSTGTTGEGVQEGFTWLSKNI